MALNTVSTEKERAGVLTRARNIVTETFDARMGGGTFLLVAGTMRAAAAPVLAGDVIRSVGCVMTTAATTLTLAKFVVYDVNNVLLGSSATVHAALNGATGWVSAALTTPINVAADGIVYIGLVVVGTTGPTLGATPGSTAVGLLDAGVGIRRLGFLQSGLADAPDPAVPTTAAVIPYFAAF